MTSAQMDIIGYILSLAVLFLVGSYLVDKANKDPVAQILLTQGCAEYDGKTGALTLKSSCTFDATALKEWLELE